MKVLYLWYSGKRVICYFDSGKIKFHVLRGGIEGDRKTELLIHVVHHQSHRVLSVDWVLCIKTKESSVPWKSKGMTWLRKIRENYIGEQHMVAHIICNYWEVVCICYDITLYLMSYFTIFSHFFLSKFNSLWPGVMTRTDEVNLALSFFHTFYVYIYSEDKAKKGCVT